MRGWASAYDAEPTLWEKFSAGVGKLFAKKPPADAELVADAVRELESGGREAEARDSEDEAVDDESRDDQAEDAEDGPADDRGEAVGEPVRMDEPIVRDYELRGGDDAVDLPVVRDYQFHSSGDDTADGAPVIPARSILDDAPPPARKPGFFARLFGRGKAKDEAEIEEFVTRSGETEAAAEPDRGEPADAEFVGAEPAEEDGSSDPFAHDEPHVEAISKPARLDRPSLEFFMRVDRLARSDAAANAAPSIDDALPTEIEPVAADAATSDMDAPASPPYVEHPTEPWVPAVPEPEVEAKPGFLARLFTFWRKPTEVQEPTSAAVDADSASDAFDAALESFEAEARVESEASARTFDSVDDALPVDEPGVTPHSSTAEVDVTAFADVSRPAEVGPARAPESDFLDFAPPPPSFEAPLDLAEGRTLEIEPAHSPAASAPPPADAFFGASVDLGDTTQAVARPVVPPAIADEDTDTGSMVEPAPPTVTAAQEAERGPFFVPKFRSFYNEIVSHKRQKAEFTAGFATAVMDYTADLSPDAAAAALSKRLQEVLELQAAEATWMGGEAAARYPDAQYAMAALADEVFAHLEWPGREAWPRHLVEQKLFRSNAKDVEFFKRVDRLLKNEADNPSPAAKDLARMYLLVLAAGYQGKYRPFGLSRPLAEYRRRLYEFISQKDPLLLYGTERKLFPQAAEKVVEGRAVARFSMLQQWAAVLVILLIGYAIISQMAWNRVSADLRDVTARVEAANNTNTSDGLAGEPR